MKPEPIYRHIGGLVRSLRRREDMAQDALAGRLGISRATLANIETGRQRILVHQLYAMAQALGVALTDLLPPLPSANVAANSAAVPIEGDLNAEQRRQVANLMGPIGAPAPHQPEKVNAAKASARPRNTRNPGRKVTR
jgi:transcriptional regulator with XRE-family HTH domain